MGDWLPSLRGARRGVLLCALTIGGLLAGAAPAAAAGHGAVALPVAGLGGLLGDIGHAVLGGVDWTVNVAGDFILNLIGGLVRDLIPRSWIHKGLEIMQWLVTVPNYGARITGPGGGHSYGFAGVNAMRGLYTWLGVAIAPLTLVYATSRAWSGQGDPPSLPITRVLIVGVALLNYTWLWGQAVALTNLLTHAILGVAAVTTGIQKMFEVLIAGAALGGLQLVGLLVMGVGAVQLLALLFVKVVLILVGALVFAIGPLMLGLVATDRGHAVAKTWLTMALGLFVLPVLWASIFAIAAVLINDASGASQVLGAGSGLGRILGGLLIAFAAIAGFWLNIKLTKAFGSLASGQLAGLLALARTGGVRGLLGGGGARSGAGGAGAGAGAGGAAAAVASLRGFASKVGGAASGAAGALLPAGRAGAALAGAGGAAGTLARGGLLGAGGALLSKGAAGAANSGLARGAASTRAGAVATRAARGAQRGWKGAAGAPDGASSSSPSTPTPQTPTTPASGGPGAPPAPSNRPPIGATTATQQGRAGGGADGSASGTPAPAPARRAPRPTSAPGPSSATPAAAPDAGRRAPGRPSNDPNDTARDAFGRAPRPTRSGRRPFKRGPRS